MTDETKPSELSIQPLTVSEFHGTSDELCLSVEKVPNGSGLRAMSTIDGEVIHSTWFGVLKIITASNEGDPKTNVDGGGMWAFSDRRLFGLLVQGKALGGRVDTNDRGNGQVVGFTLSPDLVDEVDERRGRLGKLRGVTLLGPVCGVHLDVVATMKADGTFGRGRNDQMLPAVQRFAARSTRPLESAQPTAD